MHRARVHSGVSPSARERPGRPVHHEHDGGVHGPRPQQRHLPPPPGGVQVCIRPSGAAGRPGLRRERDRRGYQDNDQVGLWYSVVGKNLKACLLL